MRVTATFVFAILLSASYTRLLDRKVARSLSELAQNPAPQAAAPAQDGKPVTDEKDTIIVDNGDGKGPQEEDITKHNGQVTGDQICKVGKDGKEIGASCHKAGQQHLNAGEGPAVALAQQQPAQAAAQDGKPVTDEKDTIIVDNGDGKGPQEEDITKHNGQVTGDQICKVGKDGKEIGASCHKAGQQHLNAGDGPAVALAQQQPQAAAPAQDGKPVTDEKDTIIVDNGDGKGPQEEDITKHNGQVTGDQICKVGKDGKEIGASCHKAGQQHLNAGDGPAVALAQQQPQAAAAQNGKPVTDEKDTIIVDNGDGKGPQEEDITKHNGQVTGDQICKVGKDGKEIGASCHKAGQQHLNAGEADAAVALAQQQPQQAAPAQDGKPVTDEKDTIIVDNGDGKGPQEEDITKHNGQVTGDQICKVGADGKEIGASCHKAGQQHLNAGDATAALAQKSGVRILAKNFSQ